MLCLYVCVRVFVQFYGRTSLEVRGNEAEMILPHLVTELHVFFSTWVDLKLGKLAAIQSKLNWIIYRNILKVFMTKRVLK